MCMTTGSEPLCTIYHDGRRVWPPEPPLLLNSCDITIYPTEQPPPEPPRLNRHERRRARKLTRTL